MKVSAKLPAHIKGASSYGEIEQLGRHLVEIKNICMTSTSTSSSTIRPSKIPIRPQENLKQLINCNNNNNNNQNEHNNNITSSTSSLVPHVARLKLCNSSPITRRDREKISFLNDHHQSSNNLINHNNENKNKNDKQFNEFLDNDNIGNHNSLLKSKERKNSSAPLYKSLDLSTLEVDTGAKIIIRKERVSK
jgi:hypothetical protein